MQGPSTFCAGVMQGGEAHEKVRRMERHICRGAPVRCKRQPLTRCVAYQPCGRLRCSRWRCASPLRQVGATCSAPVRILARSIAERV